MRHHFCQRSIRAAASPDLQLLFTPASYDAARFGQLEREPGIWERVHAAGDAILRTCVDAGGVLSGEHGIGLEKREAMPLVFTADDLDAQARLRDAFDPSGRANPQKILPRGSRCGEMQRVPEGAWV